MRPRCLQQRPQTGWIPAGVRPGATGALSALGPGGFFLCLFFFFPAFRWRVERFLVHHTKKRPYHLNMMRVTVIDKPSSEERVMVTHEGKEACCYVQGNAWNSPLCGSGAVRWTSTVKSESTKRPM